MDLLVVDDVPTHLAEALHVAAAPPAIRRAGETQRTVHSAAVSQDVQRVGVPQPRRVRRGVDVVQGDRARRAPSAQRDEERPRLGDVLEGRVRQPQIARRTFGRERVARLRPSRRTYRSAPADIAPPERLIGRDGAPDIGGVGEAVEQRVVEGIRRRSQQRETIDRDVGLRAVREQDEPRPQVGPRSEFEHVATAEPRDPDPASRKPVCQFLKRAKT